MSETPQGATALWRPNLTRLARPSAVEKFAQALVANGQSEDAATAMAGAVTDPDYARRRLADPSRIRVPGGTLLALDVTLYSAAMSVYPVNPRELGRRAYRSAGMDEDFEDIFQSLRTARDRYAELALTVSAPPVLADRLREAEAWLGEVNDLVEDIAVEGVLQATVVSALSIAHVDRTPPLTILAAIDGSSRTSAAHRLSGLTDPGKLAYDSPPGSRSSRQLIGRQLREASGEFDDLDEDLQRRARALTMPARLIVGYEPASAEPVTYDTAVRNFIGLTHIRPPARYGTHVENRATADAVLDHLAAATVDGHTYLSAVEAAWFRGDLTAAEAEQQGLSPHLDVRAADIVRSLLHGKGRAAMHVNRGIRALTAKQSPSRNERVDLVVELALRPLQNSYGLGSDDSLVARRAALGRAFRLAGVADEEFGGPLWEGLPESPWTLDELARRALDEVANPLPGGRLQTAQLELAVKAATYLVAADPIALRREGYGVDTDRTAVERSIPKLLENMLGREQGVRQAVAVIEAGRAGEPLLMVDEDGSPAGGVDGTPVMLSDAVMRDLYSSSPLPQVRSGIGAAQRAWVDVTESVEALRRAVEQVYTVPDSNGQGYVDRHGWPSAEVSRVRGDIDRLDRQLADWADLADDLERARARDAADDGSDSDEDG